MESLVIVFILGILASLPSRTHLPPALAGVLPQTHHLLPLQNPHLLALGHPVIGIHGMFALHTSWTLENCATGSIPLWFVWSTISFFSLSVPCLLSSSQTGSIPLYFDPTSLFSRFFVSSILTLVLSCSFLFCLFFCRDAVVVSTVPSSTTCLLNFLRG